MSRAKIANRSPAISIAEARKTNPQFDRAAEFVSKLYEKEIPQGKVRFESTRGKSTSGEVTNENGIVVIVAPPRDAKTQVHELAHYLENKKRESFVDIAVSEGQATFAEGLFAGKPRRFTPHFFAMLGGIGAVAILDFAAKKLSVPYILSVPLLGVNSFLLGVALAQGFVYWAFNNSLCTLAKKVGDGATAFRITLEKPPSWRGVFFPAAYYKEEIERARDKVHTN